MELKQEGVSLEPSLWRRCPQVDTIICSYAEVPLPPDNRPLRCIFVFPVCEPSGTNDSFWASFDHVKDHIYATLGHSTGTAGPLAHHNLTLQFTEISWKYWINTFSTPSSCNDRDRITQLRLWISRVNVRCLNMQALDQDGVDLRYSPIPLETLLTGASERLRAALASVVENFQ